MQIITQGNIESPGVFERLWDELTTLKFMHRLFNWLFLALATMAEFVMFIAVAYVLTHQAQPGAVAFMDHWAGPASLIILNAAPEAVLPGCFLKAKNARGQDKLAFSLNLGMGSLFLLLTLITLASFVWQFSPGAEMFILFARCSASVVYTVLVRVFSSEHGNVHTVKAEQVQDMYTQFSEQLNVQLVNMRKAADVQLVNMRRELTQELARSQTVHIEELRDELQNRLEQCVHAALSEHIPQIEPPVLDLTMIHRQVTVTVKEALEPYIDIIETATQPQLPAVQPQPALPSKSSAPARESAPTAEFNKTQFINEQLDLAEAEHREIKNADIIARAREQYGVEILRSQVSNIRAKRTQVVNTPS